MYSEKYGKVLLSCNFEFSHLDPDPLIGRVTFTEKECADIFKKKLISRLKSIFEYGNLAHDPKVIVQVRKDANDTQIPGMEADWDKLEISFDWKKMYSAYFREDKEYHRRLGAWVRFIYTIISPQHTYHLLTSIQVDTQKDAMLNIREQVDKGELDQLESFKRVFTMFGDSYQETRKQVRRSRIRREVWENDEVDWELSNDELFDDDDALKKLKDTRFAIGLGESFSDESDGGGENAEEGANSEVEGEDEDDWEDMDEDGEDEEVEDGEDELVDGEAGIQY